MPGFGFPRRLRLVRPPDFREVSRRGRTFEGAAARIRSRPNGLGHPRLGVAAPRRYGCAPRRNRFRRLVREAFRLEQHALGALDLLVGPRPGAEPPSLEALRADLRTAAARESRG